MYFFVGLTMNCQRIVATSWAQDINRTYIRRSEDFLCPKPVHTLKGKRVVRSDGALFKILTTVIFFGQAKNNNHSQKKPKEISL